MEVKVNSAEWNSLPEKDRGTIQNIIGANFKDTKIAASEDAQSATSALGNRSLSFNLSNPFCDAACGIAEAAAVAACAGLSGPAAAVCIAAAHEAGNYCRSRC